MSNYKLYMDSKDTKKEEIEEIEKRILKRDK